MIENLLGYNVQKHSEARGLPFEDRCIDPWDPSVTNCHPRNSKRRKIDSRSSCPSHLACEWTVSGGQNETRAGRTWMDFGFFSGMTRFQKLKEIFPWDLLRWPPFFLATWQSQVARQAGCCHAWQHVMGSKLGNSVAECRKFSIQLYPTLDLVCECPMFFSQTYASCLFCSLAKLFPSFHKTYFLSIIMFWRLLQIGAGHTIASWAHLLRLRRSGETQVSLQRDGCQRNEEFCPVEAYWFWMNLLAKLQAFWKESVPD